MRRFLPGFVIAPLVLFGWMLWSELIPESDSARNWLILSISVVAAPLLAAAAAVALIHIRRPRRWLTPGAPGLKRTLLAGVFAGTTAMAASPFAIYFANCPWTEEEIADWDPELDIDRVPDAAVLAAVSFPPALLAVWLMPRRQPGLCIRCGYDIRYSIESARCPECGRALGE